MLHTRSLSVFACLFLVTFVAPAAFAGVLEADLSITKTDGAATAIPGNGIAYTIVATNGGPTDVTGGTVTDNFPAILEPFGLCTWTCVASAGSTCTAAGSGSISDPVDLLNGGTATYSVSCVIDPSATGTLDNTASVSSALSDPVPGNNSATDSDTLTPQADLVISAVAAPVPAQAGAAYTITVEVTNNGPSTATGVAVDTTLPAGVTFVSTIGCTEDPNGVPVCNLGILGPFSTATFVINAVAPTDGGALDHTFIARSAVSDPAPGDETVVLAISFAAPIPTLGTWGLIALVLGLCLLALRRLRSLRTES